MVVARLDLPLDGDPQLIQELELSTANLACFLLIFLYSESRGEYAYVHERAERLTISSQWRNTRGKSRAGVPTMAEAIAAAATARRVTGEVHGVTMAA